MLFQFGKRKQQKQPDTSPGKKAETSSNQIVEVKKDVNHKKRSSLLQKRKKSFYMIITLSVAIAIALGAVAVSFAMSNPNANSSNSDGYIANANISDELWKLYSSEESASSEISSAISSESSQEEVSSALPVQPTIKPSTGKVTTAPEYQYNPKEDVPKKAASQVNVDRSKVESKDESTIPVIPLKGNGSATTSSKAPASSAQPSSTHSSAPQSSTDSSDSSTNHKSYVVSTDIDNLNVRTGPGTTYESIGKLEKDKEYPYISEQKDSAGTVWYQIQYSDTAQSWVFSEYTKKEEKTSTSSSSGNSSNSTSIPSASSPSSSAPKYQVGWNTIDGHQYYYDGANLVKGWANIGNFRYYFDPVTGAKKSSVGIDVSKYQGDINWSQVKAAGVDFAFIRVGYRGYETGKLSIDPKFVQNITNANKVGIKVGVYFYSTAISEKEGVEEADFVLNAIQGYKVDLPIVIDVEHQTDRVAHLTKTQRTNNTLAFLNRIKSVGKTAMLYTGYYFYNTYLESSRLKSFPLWIAYYTDNDQKVASVPYQYWQYTSTGRVSGISGDVDLNVMLH